MANRDNKKPVSAFDLFTKSYELVLKNIKTFGALLALPAIASLIATSKYNLHSDSSKYSHINFFNGTEPAYAIVGVAGAGLVVFLILAVAALLIQAMLTSLEVEASKGKTPDFKKLWEMGRKYWLRLFGLALVIGVYIIVASIIGVMLLLVLHSTAIGLLFGVAIIAAAVLFVLTHYFLAPYAMVDEDLPIFAAMERSADLSKPYAGSVLSVIGVTILLSLSGIVPILGPIISFALGALYSVAPALRYEELKKLAK